MTRAKSPGRDSIGLSSGLPQGLGAYLIWGALPLLIHLLANVNPFEIVAWRILMSLALLLPILALRGMLGEFAALLGSRRAWPLIGSGICIAINWFVYVWAVNNGHVVAGSLGYFLNPLFNVVLGRLVLGERLNRVQMLAVAIAAVGVAVLAIDAWRTLWISLALGFSFSLYGLIRKMAAAPPMQGLAAETLFLLPVGFGIVLLQAGHGSFAPAQGPATLALLFAIGGLTLVTLVLFAGAVRLMTLTALGILQYLTPTLQFLLGILFFGELLKPSQLVSFALIWLALIIFTINALAGHRRNVADALAADAPTR